MMFRPLLLSIVLAGTTWVAAARAEPASQPTPEPKVQRTVIEDDGVRIEELKVRGQAVSVVVQSKQLGVKPYELLLGDASRDPSQRGHAAGQRVWHLFSF